MELEGFLSFFEMDRKETFQLENLFPDSGSNLELKKVTECEVQIDENRGQNSNNIFQSR